MRLSFGDPFLERIPIIKTNEEMKEFLLQKQQVKISFGFYTQFKKRAYLKI